MMYLLVLCFGERWHCNNTLSIVWMSGILLSALSPQFKQFTRLNVGKQWYVYPIYSQCYLDLYGEGWQVKFCVRWEAFWYWYLQYSIKTGIDLVHYFADVLMNKRTKSYCFIMTVLLRIPVHWYERERESCELFFFKQGLYYFNCERLQSKLWLSCYWYAKIQEGKIGNPEHRSLCVVAKCQHPCL